MERVISENNDGVHGMMDLSGLFWTLFIPIGVSAIVLGILLYALHEKRRWERENE